MVWCQKNWLLNNILNLVITKRIVHAILFLQTHYLNYNMKKYFLLIFLFSSVMTVFAQNAVIEVSDVATSGQLTVTATTFTANGTYAPRNVVAMWIQDSSGKFVKTMLILANARKAHLTNWVTATPVGNSIDAISGATQTSHGTRSCIWNGTDALKMPVADGTYTVKMEMTESNSGSRVGTFTFDKGPNAQTLTPTNIASFSNISITWTPAPTAVEKVQIDKLYTVYPNPTVSSVFISGPDIREIQIRTLSGKSVLKTNQLKVDLSALASGIYLAEITTDKGFVYKKIVKE